MKNPSPVGEVKKGSPARSRIVVNTKHLLYSDTLEDLGRSSIVVEDGRIAEISGRWVGDADYNVDVVMPLLVNTHVHLSDARIPEKCIGLPLGAYVGRKGVKHPYIRLVRKPLIPPELYPILAIYGIVVDYQEIHMDCLEYRRILGGIGTEYIGLSRPPRWDHTSREELEEIASRCGGIGVSNPSVIPPWTLNTLADLSRRYIVSAHVSETMWMEERGGLHYLLGGRVKPRHVVHGVFLEDWEYRLLAENDIVLVVNPRSNLWFTERIPRVDYLYEVGGRFAIGSDNAGCFHPDIRVDAELLYTYYPMIDPRIIVEALTINGYLAVGREPYVVEEGREAFFIGFNIGLASERTSNIYASIVKRFPYSDLIIVFKHGRHYVIDKRLRRTPGI